MLAEEDGTREWIFGGGLCVEGGEVFVEHRGRETLRERKITRSPGGIFDVSFGIMLVRLKA
jgi:hypothetical protein